MVNEALSATLVLHLKQALDAEGLSVSDAARRTGRNERTLANKLNPTQEQVLTVVDLFDLLNLLSIDRRLDILNLLVTPLGYHVFEQTTAEDLGDMALLNAWAEWHAATGHTADEIRSSLSDQKINPQEYERIRQSITKDASLEMGLLQRLKQYVVSSRSP